jgi:hypothetical protein
MTKKVYRTAQGKMVDLGALQLRNENVRAVGNMGVNARGDLVDSQNQSIDSRNKQVAKQYQRQTSNVSNTPVAGKKTPTVDIPAPPENFEDDFDKGDVTAENPRQGSSTTTVENSGGLAAAIARARQVKQDPMKTQKEISKKQEGVRKI